MFFKIADLFLYLGWEKPVTGSARISLQHQEMEIWRKDSQGTGGCVGRNFYG